MFKKDFNINYYAKCRYCDSYEIMKTLRCDICQKEECPECDDIVFNEDKKGFEKFCLKSDILAWLTLDAYRLSLYQYGC